MSANAKPTAFPTLNLKPTNGRLSPDQLDELAQEQGVPVLVHPKPTTADRIAAAAQDPEWADEVHAHLAETTPSAAPSVAAIAPREPRARKATPRARMVRLNIEVPDYVMQAIKEKMVKDKTTVRGIVMKGLRSIKIPIPEEDMIDDARRRKK